MYRVHRCIAKRYFNETIGGHAPKKRVFAFSGGDRKGSACSSSFKRLFSNPDPRINTYSQTWMGPETFVAVVLA